MQLRSDVWNDNEIILNQNICFQLGYDILHFHTLFSTLFRTHHILFFHCQSSFATARSLPELIKEHRFVPSQGQKWEFIFLNRRRNPNGGARHQKRKDSKSFVSLTVKFGALDLRRPPLLFTSRVIRNGLLPTSRSLHTLHGAPTQYAQFPSLATHHARASPFYSEYAQKSYQTPQRAANVAA